MATIEKRGDSWRVLVRRKGHRAISKTFRLKAHADRFARDIEQGIDAKRVGAEDPLVGDILDSYIKLKSNCHISHLKHAARTKAMFSHYRVSELNGLTLKKVIDANRLGPTSGEKHAGILKSALHVYEVMVGFPLGLERFKTATKGLKKAGVIKTSRQRVIRVRRDEIEAIKAAASYRIPFDKLIDLSVLTCLRLSELVRIRGDDLDHERKMVFVRDRKHPTQKIGNDSWVPLLNGAYEIIQSLPKGKERIVPHHPKSIQNLWMAATAKVGIDKPWHALRHEGISRLFEQGYGIAEVALVSGHRDWKSLRIYVNLAPESLHDGPKGRDI